MKPFDWGNYETHCYWMKQALILGQKAANLGDVPVGALIINSQGKLIAEGLNCKEKNHDPTAHAEIMAIRQATQKLGSWNLEKCTLYVTLEPCIMCSGAIIHSRLGLLVYGVDDPKSGTIRTVLNLPDSAASNHRLSVLSGILEKECRQQLQDWFKQKRHKKNDNNIR